MPEAAIHEDRYSRLREDNVGGPTDLGNRPSANTKPQAHRVQKGTKHLLRPSVPAPTAEHRMPYGVA